MREKLIELLADSEHMSYEKQADHLIANGVTIAKWIPVTERLPKHFGTFIVALKDMNGYCSTNAADYDYSQQRWRGLPMGARDEVTHWMPLPEPPKGE
jgi:hypothetical protein